VRCDYFLRELQGPNALVICSNVGSWPMAIFAMLPTNSTKFGLSSFAWMRWPLFRGLTL
jgi:hypothetical protein